ncbi:MAG: hypothetical protein KME25_29950 [Symplocastrum torsivum CPER-KK1]|uniref:Uncharacterized protein n=1 Tax=Symplocastrum torsivum CPER-KK1 TaxID=450513 RepID=A0A951PQZ1_9CYAN|nr:hypothetical protein [Symplocastrum torsivum CPER-KK1]
MKLNYFIKPLSIVGRWIVTTLFCVSAIAFVWQGAFFSNPVAMAAPTATLIADAGVGDKVQGKVSTDAGRAKNFIEDTKDKVKEAANKNASRVDQADDEGSFVERKAKSDRDTIEKRAEEDAARTEKAVDNTKNAVQSAIDNIKGAFD